MHMVLIKEFPMSYRSLAGSFLATLILVPAPAFGQRVREEDTQAAQRTAKRPAAVAQPPDLARVTQLIVDRTNEIRRREGKRELKIESHLSDAAQAFAEFMARTDKYGHTADGKEPWERGKEHSYAYCLFLENIAYQYSPASFTVEELARGFMDGWEHSPPHRKNLLDADIYDLGVGVAYSAKSGRYYVVQDFGRPKSKEIVFQVTNDTDATLNYKVDGKTQAIEPGYTITHTRCRPPEVVFSPVDERKTYHPGNDAHFIIDKAGTRYVVRSK
jgi:uncharacterized protein YkwD